MNILKCDICGKVFEYDDSIKEHYYKSLGHSLTERVANKVKLYHISRPPRDQYDDSDLFILYSYDVCPSCAHRLVEFIDKEKANHENL